jgi:hypothetical protein
MMQSVVLTARDSWAQLPARRLDDKKRTKLGHQVITAVSLHVLGR